MKRRFAGFLAMVLVAVLTLTGCSSMTTPSGLTGNYRQDTLALVDSIKTAIQVPAGSPEAEVAQAAARTMINDYAALYRRQPQVTTLNSYTTVRTALNSLAGHYSSYPNRPLPENLKGRLNQELQQVEAYLQREAS